MVLGKLISIWIKLDRYLSLSTKTNPQRIKDLQMKLKTLKPLEENTDSAEHDIGVREDFLSRTPFARELRPATDTWDIIKLKNVHTAKETISQAKKKHIE